MSMFYGGPNQFMPLGSSIAALCAFLLLFFNKLLALFNRVVNRFKRKPAAEDGHAAARPNDCKPV